MNRSKYKTNKRKKIILFLQYVSIIAAIYASATPISSLYYTQTALVFFFSAFILMIVTAALGNLKITKSGFRETAIVILLIMVTAIINLDHDISYYLGLVVLIVGAYFVAISVDYSSYEDALIRTFVIISVISFIITVFLNARQAYTIHLPRLITETRTGAVSWGNFYYVYFVWDYWGRFGFIRNSACFREPGVWGAFCAIVLAIKILETREKNVRSKTDIIQLVILSIGTISSFSTTAILCFIVCMLLLFYNGKSINRKTLLVSVFIILGMTLVFNRYSDVFFAKFVYGTSEYRAYGDRFAGIKNSIKAFATNPVFGAGYTDYYDILEGSPLTVAFVVLLGEFGILGFIWYVSRILHYSKMISHYLVDLLLFAFILIMVLFAQNLLFTPMFLILCLYAGAKRRRTSGNVDETPKKLASSPVSLGHPPTPLKQVGE